MMNLTKKSLPNTVCVGGRDFSIYTDFRLWMRFEIAVYKMKKDRNIEIGYLFKNEHPQYCNINDLFVFSRPKHELPRSIGGSSDVIVLDYELDADLIYSAFLGQYGIDLIDVEELHWHKFLALLGGLNESTRLREVMGYRSYKKDNRKDRDIYEELKAAWEIEPLMSDEEIAELDEFSKAFGG
jgi:hypothetical protein